MYCQSCLILSLREAVHIEAQRCATLKDLFYRAHAPVPGAPPNYQVDALVAQSQQFFKAAEKKPLLLPTAWMLICEVLGCPPTLFQIIISTPVYMLSY